jgi:hypothetical protein
MPSYRVQTETIVVMAKNAREAAEIALMRLDHRGSLQMHVHDDTNDWWLRVYREHHFNRNLARKRQKYHDQKGLRTDSADTQDVVG